MYKGSTNQKTGESMEKPGKKLKKFLIITGTTGLVYAGLKYLLPLVAPFFIGYTLALILRPSVRFIRYRFQFSAFGKTWKIPSGLIGAAEIGIIFGGLGILVWQGILRLCRELQLLAVRLPLWMMDFDSRMAEYCMKMERAAGLKSGCLFETAAEMTATLGEKAKESLMPFLMTNSLPAAAFFIRLTLVCLVSFLAAVLSLQEMEELRHRRDQSLFRREFNLIGSRLVQTGKAWFKSQGIILLLTCGLSIGAMIWMGNPYAVLAGIAIALLDALPLLGAGAVLLPWAFLCVLGGQWKDALILSALYLACYFARQYLEAKYMGSEVGLSPLETLAAVYVGMELFGFLGFILGPLGLLLIEDLTEIWEEGADRGKLT